MGKGAAFLVIMGMLPREAQVGLVKWEGEGEGRLGGPGCTVSPVRSSAREVWGPRIEAKT